ncbi:MAG: acyl-CoA dehydrogenase family protein [Solirubrobacteraceae bacterium]
MAELAGLARASGDEVEAAGRLPAPLVSALRDSQLARAWVPRELGGAEMHPRDAVAALEDLACADGSTAWCAMVALTSGAIAAHVPEPEAQRIFGDPAVICGGVFAPRGRAVAQDGGFRVNGRWSFASGCLHSDWLMGGCIVEGAAPLAGGGPDVHMALLERSQLRVEETWTASGLRGTASHDIVAQDTLVPAPLLVSMFTAPVLRGGALYAFPRFGRLALGIAAVGLGIARGALGDLTELASRRRPAGSSRPLAERGGAQAAVARAHAALAAARSYVEAAVDAAWDAASRGELDTGARAELRAASTHAARTAASVVDAMYELGGGDSIYAHSPLQRRFRDIHVLTQHMMVAPTTYELVGRVLFGLPADISQL